MSRPEPLWRRAVFALRPEEFATLLMFLPMAFTLALMSAARTGAIARLIAMLVATAFFLFVIRVKPRWRFVRDALPFLFCASIYASLHDLILFYNAPDITGALYRWDVALFGFEPTIWAERFANPFLTDYFTVCYWLFYVLAPLLGLLLYLKKDYRAFRYTMVSVVLCLYTGYIGYVAWPASAPRLFIPGAYSVPLHGLPLLDYTRAATAAVPLTAYGAFPSLHCAVALLAVLLAWRFLRWFFWVQVPFAAGLIIGTVYLRHHWVVDILAGFVLTFFAYWAGPKLEDWWSRQASSREGSGRAGWAKPVNPSLSEDSAEVPRPGQTSRVAAKVMES